VIGLEIRWISQPLPLPAVIGGRWRHLERAVVGVPELDAQVDDARQLAVEMITREATAAGADAVIGVRRIPGVIDWREVSDAARVAAGSVRRSLSPRVSRPLDYQLIGTAVRDLSHPSPDPRLSTVSPADFWKLRQAGWTAIGVVGGCSHQFGRAVSAGYAAGEVDVATGAWAAARAAAFDQLRAETAALAADGVVGIEMQVDHRTIEWRQPQTDLDARGLLVGVTIIATAITRSTGQLGGLPSPSRILTLP